MLYRAGIRFEGLTVGLVCWYFYGSTDGGGLHVCGCRIHVQDSALRSSEVCGVLRKRKGSRAHP